MTVTSWRHLHFVLPPRAPRPTAVTTLTPSGSPAATPNDSLDPATDLTATATAFPTATATDPPAWRWEESDDAVRAYGSLVGLLLIGNLPFLHSSKLADLPYFVGLALVTIYIGAHRGLTTRQRQQISIKEVSRGRGLCGFRGAGLHVTAPGPAQAFP